MIKSVNLSMLSILASFNITSNAFAGRYFFGLGSGLQNSTYEFKRTQNSATLTKDDKENFNRYNDLMKQLTKDKAKKREISNQLLQFIDGINNFYQAEGALRKYTSSERFSRGSIYTELGSRFDKQYQFFDEVQGIVIGGTSPVSFSEQFTEQLSELAEMAVGLKEITSQDIEKYAQHILIDQFPGLTLQNLAGDNISKETLVTDLEKLVNEIKGETDPANTEEKYQDVKEAREQYNKAKEANKTALELQAEEEKLKDSIAEAEQEINALNLSAEQIAFGSIADLKEGSKSKISILLSAMGGYRFDRGNFAFITEAGIDFNLSSTIGSNSKNELEVKNTNNLFLAQKVGYKFTKNSLSYLTGGVSYGDYKIDYNSIVDKKHTITSFILGVGHEFMLNKNLAMFTEFNLTMGGKKNIEVNNIKVGEIKFKSEQVKIGARYYF